MAEILEEGTVALWNRTKLYVQFMRAWDKETLERTSQYIVKLKFTRH